MTYLFNYGSNNLEQLSDRLGYKIDGEAAYLPKHGRVFRGWSRNWGGGVASITKDANRTVYGYIAEVTSLGLMISSYINHNYWWIFMIQVSMESA